jgi:amino acid permease
MKVEYELTPQEFLDFNLDYLKNNINIKKMRKTLLICSVALLFLCVLFLAAFSEVEFFLLLLGVTCLILYFIIPYILEKSLLRGVKKDIYKNAYGKKKIIFYDDYFRVESAESNSEVKYTALSKIHRVGAYVCLVLMDNTVIAIPERYVQNSEIIEFVNSKINNAKLP